MKQYLIPEIGSLHIINGEQLKFVGIIRDYALYCELEDLKDKTDWKLKEAWPNKTELCLMYENKDLLGGFTDDWYWSSTEYTSGSAWFQRLSDGSQDFNGKYVYYRVRCVRRIKLDDLMIREFKEPKITDKFNLAIGLASHVSKVNFVVDMPEGKYQVSVRKLETNKDN